MDRTGRALGTLRAVIYFENASGHLVLPPEEIGQGTMLAQQIYAERYRSQGYEWREARTLEEVDRLQGRLIQQEQGQLNYQAKVMDQQREQVRGEIADNLRQRMVSADCSAFERDFIEAWLRIREEKRKQFTDVWNQRNMYLWAREMDESTKVEDRMK